MTLEQLRIFVAVAEREHVTRAAADLGLTQSAVSAAIRALETRHDVHLFDRVARRVVLTEVGRGFLAEARAVLARADLAESRLADLAGRIAGPLHIEASLTIAAYWLPARLVAFRTRFPEVEVRLGVGNTAHVADAVAEGRAEIGFVEGAVESPVLRGRAVARDHLAVIVAPDHPLAGTPEPSPEVLAGLDWVLREPGSGTRSEFETAMRRRAVAPEALKVTLELPSNEAILAAVMAGGGAAALSLLVAAPALAAGRLVAVVPDLMERPFVLLRHGDRRPTRAAAAFADMLDGVS